MITKRIVFDFYHTLVEFDQTRPTMSELLTGLGYYCPAELEAIWNSDGFDGYETPSHTSKPSYWDWRFNNLSQLAQLAGVPQAEVPSIVEMLLENDQAWTVKARPGVLSLMEHLVDQGFSIGLCSNWDYDINKYLKQAGISQIAQVVTSAEVGARKPHPKPFLQIVQKLSALPSEVYYVGDSWRADVIGALRAGMRPIWLTHERNNPLPRLVKIVGSLEELQERIVSDAL